MELAGYCQRSLRDLGAPLLPVCSLVRLNKGCGEGSERGFDSFGFRHPTLRHVFAAAAAATEFRHRLFHQRAHVEGLAGGLGEDQRRLRRCGGEQGDDVRREARQLLGKQLEEFMSRSENVRTTSLRPLVSGVSARSAAAWAAASSSCDCSRCLRSDSDFVERFAGLLGDVVDVRGEKRGGFGERGEVAAGGGDGALSGDEFYAPSLADFFCLAQEDAADLSGLADVRAAAGAEVEVVDVDEAEFVALGGRKFAQA